MTVSAWLRVLLAGPGALAGAVLFVLVMPLWVPGGSAGIDNLVLPVILFPLIWAILFFAALLDRGLVRAAVVITGVIVVDGLVLAGHFGLT